MNTLEKLRKMEDTCEFSISSPTIEEWQTFDGKQRKLVPMGYWAMSVEFRKIDLVGVATVDRSYYADDFAQLIDQAWDDFTKLYPDVVE